MVMIGATTRIPRKAIVVEWAPILHGYGWTARQIGIALGVSHSYIGRMLRELGIVPRPAKDMVEALERLTADERTALEMVHGVN